ncbi:hypothetical protein M422DRAFT_249094 [Sphaerobolus stellatus SS14]|uniref:Uncharacterized protein n=1 Tax=Sphaerobolus stellatus (strain SS14) TaxID=990650 RepID=A0A0C9T8G7_SPHS4|nr:hypothetical protein M422DRAFT_273726 [Sphaerobolus stellatus SS14]KIJ47245.1 hypothetical protein M422DRAFT_249094 [Sphaerobolus stellatus SS14]
MSTNFLCRLLLLTPQLETLTLAYFSNHDALRLLDVETHPNHSPHLKFLSLRSSMITSPVAEGILVGRCNILEYISFKDCNVIAPPGKSRYRPRPSKHMDQLLYKFRRTYPDSTLSIKTPRKGYLEHGGDFGGSR